MCLRLQGPSLDCRTLLSSLPSLIHSKSDFYLNMVVLPAFSPFSLIRYLQKKKKSLVFNAILCLISRIWINTLKDWGPTLDGKAHFLGFLGFQADSENLWLPVREYSNNAASLVPGRESGRKMRCFRNNRRICEKGLLWADVMLDINWQLID